MPGVQKIDYRKLSKEAPDEPSQQTQGDVQQLESEEKSSFFGSLIYKWSVMDNKIKLELAIFIVVILVTLTMVGYYFSKSITPKVVIPEEERDWPEENIPPDTAPESEYMEL